MTARSHAEAALRGRGATSPLARRVLKKPARTTPPLRIQPVRMESAAAAGEPPETEPPERALTEWHDMTPGERLAAWAELRAWVTWLADRYELTVEHRLPHCWALHPGLVEELRALTYPPVPSVRGGPAERLKPVSPHCCRQRPCPRRAER
jgi:hypothetical protein